MTKSYTLDASELATVLAALRCWQRTLTWVTSKPPEWDIATNDGTVEPLTVHATDEDGIDLLIERLNVEDNDGATEDEDNALVSSILRAHKERVELVAALRSVMTATQGHALDADGIAAFVAANAIIAKVQS